jgi:effector-binding domain-containing protein
MQTITTEPILVHAASRTLTLPDVAAFRDQTIPDMLNDAESWGLVATGPWTFVSSQLPQDTETSFDLIICRPIEAGGDYGGQFQIIELPAMTAATAHYEGPLSGIYTGAYVPLLEDLLTNEVALSGEVRELYHVLADPDSPDNQVDILIGIASPADATADTIEAEGRTIDDEPS